MTAAAVDQALTPPDLKSLEVQAAALKHPVLPPVRLKSEEGLSPDDAAVIAVLINPSLRAVRDNRALAEAQLLQAGLLPNPELTGDYLFPVAGALSGTNAGHDLALSWELTSLISHGAKVQEARAHSESVALDVAWQEWQVAEAAKRAVFGVVSLDAQAALQEEMSRRLEGNLGLVRQAAAKGLVTEVDVAAAESASDQAQATLLDLQQKAIQQRLQLKQALGLPPGQEVRLRKDLALPARLALPAESEILAGLEDRRLDLVALRKGYESQEAGLRAAVLEQFPKISVAVPESRDTGNIYTVGPSVTITLPVFDRNQGAIAQEKATRQQLFDEYVNRIFESRSEIAALLHNARSLERQIGVAETVAAPALQRLVDTYSQAVKESQADVLSYYTAWNELIANRVEVLSLKQQLAETGIALEIAAGVYRLDALKQTRDEVKQ